MASLRLVRNELLSVRTFFSRATSSASRPDVRERVRAENMKAQQKVFNIPNILTMSRIATTPAIGYLIWNGMHTPALALFAFSATTDMLDGYIARRYKQVSGLGAILDPIADKLLMTTCLVAMYHASLFPVWYVKCIIARDLTILVAGATIRFFSFSEDPSMKKMIDFNNYPARGFEPVLSSKLCTLLQCSLIGIQLATHDMVGNLYYDWSIFAVQVATIGTAYISMSKYATRMPNLRKH